MHFWNRVYVLRENLENVENVEKSGKNEKKMLRSGKNQGDLFPANLRCIDLKCFCRNMPLDPLKSFRTCIEKFKLGQGKVLEKSGFVYTPCGRLFTSTGFSSFGAKSF